MKVDKDEEFMLGSQLHQPDGSVWIYVKAVDNLEPNQYLDFNVNGSAMKFKGGFRMPPGLCANTVPMNWYFWACVRIAQPAAKQDKGILVPDTKKNIEKPNV